MILSPDYSQIVSNLVLLLEPHLALLRLHLGIVGIWDLTCYSSAYFIIIYWVHTETLLEGNKLNSSEQEVNYVALVIH